MTDAEVGAACLVIACLAAPLGLVVHLTDRLLERWWGESPDRAWYVAMVFCACLTVVGVVALVFLEGGR